MRIPSTKPVPKHHPATIRRDLNRKREELLQYIPDWMHDINIHSGMYHNDAYSLCQAFAEWLDAKSDDRIMGRTFRQLVKGVHWNKALHTHFKHIRYRRTKRVAGTKWFLNYIVVPKNPPTHARYVACPTCSKGELIQDNSEDGDDLIDLDKMIEKARKEKQTT